MKSNSTKSSSMKSISPKLNSMKLRTSTAILATAFGTVATSQASLVSYWSFDTDFTADAGGSAFDLTAVNGASAGVAGGKFGNAGSFSRDSLQHAVTSGNVLAANADFSYSAWYNLSVADMTGSNRYFVLETSFADGVSSTQAWTASIGLRDLGGTDSVQIFTSPSLAVGQTAMTTNVWQNVVVTFDADGGTTSGGIINAYLDGSGTPFAIADNLASTNAVEGLVIGGHRSGTGRNFDGLIDEVAFFDHVLLPTEITSLQSTAVPEPSGIALFGLSGFALGAFP
jgi:alkaline phosphatase D